jgi:Reverse transcriptase (RNA-dependent DNA polymerase)
MTLGNMRANGVRSLAVSCWQRRHEAIVSADRCARRGIPQGSPISPLLANLYMRRFVLGWKMLGLERSLRSRIVTYADDLVILCRRGKAEVAFATTAQDHRQAEAHDQREGKRSSTGRISLLKQIGHRGR